jgi:ribosomal protein S18 acetylase RimI-like enzyme
MEIRQAHAADENAVCRLWETLLAFYRKETGRPVLQRSFRYAVGHPRQVRIYVAVMDGAIAGTASLHLGHYSTWNDNWYGHIEDVVVAPEFRRRGVGLRLIRHLIAVAEEEGLARLELNTLATNHAARRLYEQLGFKTDSVVYELPLK